MKNIFSVHYVLVLVLLTGLYSCGSIKPVSIKGIENFKTGSGLTKPEFTFDIALENPNKFGVTVKRMGVNLSLNDSAIAGINIPSKTRIAAGSVITVPVTIQIYYLKIKNNGSKSKVKLLSGNLFLLKK
ncbi:MAG: LEA type 2 family protein [Bacteroidetes bacterium]|nr:LEA type 2 family protein [Bacteroidota bacterium]